MNNPNRECKGFKFNALMKLNDVRSRGETKVTLMHALAEIIAEKEPDLLTLIDEMNNVAMAADGALSRSLFLASLTLAPPLPFSLALARSLQPGGRA